MADADMSYDEASMSASMDANTADADAMRFSGRKSLSILLAVCGTSGRTEPRFAREFLMGINYCGTEYPQQCYYYGQLCYVNNGYWWTTLAG